MGRLKNTIIIHKNRADYEGRCNFFMNEQNLPKKEAKKEARKLIYKRHELYLDKLNFYLESGRMPKIVAEQKAKDHVNQIYRWN